MTENNRNISVLVISLSYHYYIVELVNGLDSNDVAVDLIVMDMIKIDLGDDWRKHLNQGVKAQEIGRKNRNLFSSIIHILINYPVFIYKAIFESYDVIHIQQDFKSVLLIPVIVLFKLSNTNIVYTWHEPNMRKSESKLRKIVFPILSKSIVYLHDDIIVHGEELSSRVLDSYDKIIKSNVHNVSYHSIEILNNFCNPEFGGDFYNKFDNCVLFFGGIKPDKGLESLIECAKMMEDNDTGFIIAGSCNEEYLKTIESKAEGSNINIISRYVPTEDVSEMFRRSDLVALPYTYATQSSVLHIAYGFSLPVVVSSEGSLSEDVTERSGKVIEANDPEALYSSITEILSNYEIFVEGAKEQRDNLNTNTISKQTKSVYEEYK